MFDPDRVRDTTGMWDGFIDRWMRGEDPAAGPLAPWFRSYDGKGDAVPVPEGIPEPFQGGTSTTPELCYFALNPGQPFLGRPGDLWRKRHPMPDLQSREGLFARQAREAGGYTRWVADGIDWTDISPTPNKFVVERHRFANAWLQREVTLGEVLGVELWPWHSCRFDQSRFQPGLSALDLIEEHVLGLVTALGVETVFTFGKVWWRLFAHLGFTEVATIKADTDHWDEMPKHREVRLFRRDGLGAVAEWHKGSAGPPKPSEVPHLRDLIDRRLY